MDKILKKLPIVATVALLVAGALFFVGCEKENKTEENKTEVKTDNGTKELLNVKWVPVKHVDLANNTETYPQSFDSLFSNYPPDLVNEENMCGKDTPWWMRICLADTCKSKEMYAWKSSHCDTLSNMCFEMHGFYNDFLIAPIHVDTSSHKIYFLRVIGSWQIDVFEDVDRFGAVFYGVDHFEMPSSNTLNLYYDNNKRYLQFKKIGER